MRHLIWQSVVVLVASHFAVAALAQQPIAWQQDLEAAKRLASQTNRLVVVHFWAPWCDPCMALEQSVFNQPGVGQQLETSFVPVKLNVDQHRDIAAQFGVRSIPTDVVIKPDGSLVGSTPSPQMAQHYIGRLNQIAASAAPAAAAAAVAAAPTANTPSAPAGLTSAAPPKEDRYAEYYRNRGGEQAPAAPPVAAPNPGYQAPPLAPNAASMATADQIPMNQPLPATPAQAPPSAAQWQQPGVPAPNHTAAAPWAAAGVPQQSAPPMAPMQQQAPQGQFAGQPAMGLPPGSPALGLDGYCPVQLIENWSWVVGDRQWGAIHEGRTYLFAGPKERQMFLENPHKYAPVEAGDDAVVLREQGLRVPGRRECGGVYDGRLYLFSSEESYAKFEQAAKLAGSQQRPSPYAVPVMQAMRPR